MPSVEESLSSKVQTSFLQLVTAAADLNAVSDELGKSVAELDAALKQLNLGVTVWVQVEGNTDASDDSYWSHNLGYAKIDGKWGIALSQVVGNWNDPDGADVESWLFNEAPRRFRLAAIGHIPELLQNLSQEANKMAEKVKGKLAEAKEVAGAVKEVAALGATRQRLPLRPVKGDKK